jgi:hypothetical protein
LTKALERVLGGEVRMQEALREHEKELKERSRPAVLASRKACLDAHRYFECVAERSPLLTRGLVTKVSTPRL